MDFKSQDCSKGAFSLLEVMFALAITTYALLLLIALIPMGLKTTSETVQDIQVSMIMEQIEKDIRSHPVLGLESSYYKIKIPPQGKSVEQIYFGNSSEFLGERSEDAFFRVQITMEVDEKRKGFQTRIFVSSPAEIPIEKSKKVFQISTYVKAVQK